jgi:hypothetical protein
MTNTVGIVSLGDTWQIKQRSFLERQISFLERCYRSYLFQYWRAMVIGLSCCCRWKITLNGCIFSFFWICRICGMICVDPSLSVIGFYSMICGDCIGVFVWVCMICSIGVMLRGCMIFENCLSDTCGS